MKGRIYRVHGDTTQSDIVMRDTWFPLALSTAIGLGDDAIDYMVDTLGKYVDGDYQKK